MKWNTLQDEASLQSAINLSKEKPVLIFKHSTRCSISATALDRLERSWNDQSSITPYYLDLISYRNISNKIAEDFNITHESPQALIIKNGKCVYNASHLGISYAEILKQI